MSEPRPTMTDVARAARVSLKTVSRVVNREPGVAQGTAERVEEAIADLGFRRNDLARALRQGQVSRTLGLVIEDVANPFYSAIARGVEEVTRARGLLVIAGSSDEDPERERTLVRLLCERRVDGLVVVPAGNDHAYLLPELRLGTPIVFLDRPPGNVDADAILLDNVGGARAAVLHLLERGHRRIAMIADAPRIFTAVERLRGYREALAEHGLPVDGSLVRLGPHDVSGAEAAARDLLGGPDPPTAIFAGNNRMTLGVLRALAGDGRATALVGFDDVELGELLRVPVTVVAYDAAELGRQGAELVCRRLEGEAGPPERRVLPTELVVRGSGELA
jgi:LacI family transcriptional regulator